MNAPERIWVHVEHEAPNYTKPPAEWLHPHKATGYVRDDMFDAEKARADKAEALLAEAVEALRALRDSLQSVIQHSEGVAGLHRNGDVAPWETLFASGAYEDWFGTSFDDACAILAKINEAKNG